MQKISSEEIVNGVYNSRIAKKNNVIPRIVKISAPFYGAEWLGSIDGDVLALDLLNGNTVVVLDEPEADSSTKVGIKDGLVKYKTPEYEEVWVNSNHIISAEPLKAVVAKWHNRSNEAFEREGYCTFLVKRKQKVELVPWEDRC